MNKNQIEMVSIEQLIPKNHAYRAMKDLLDFNRIADSVNVKESETGAIGFTKNRLILCLILQFMEDLSDREFERFIAENISAKWFCGFGITEKTPDFTTVCKFRNRIGCKRMSEIFEALKTQLREKGYMTDLFHFVDSTALISKLQMWKERDKAIQDGYEKFNNKVIEKYADDPEVRIGSKGNNKFWVGFKKTVSVGMEDGFIEKVAITKANVTDAEAAKNVLPKEGAVVADKGYIGIITLIAALGLHPMVILKQNMKNKNRDLDRYISGLRCPYEGTFSKQNNHTRYKGIVKNQAAEFLNAVAFNIKRLLSIEKEKNLIAC
jgi:IS5 family transposase